MQDITVPTDWRPLRRRPMRDEQDKLLPPTDPVIHHRVVRPKVSLRKPTSSLGTVRTSLSAIVRGALITACACRGRCKTCGWLFGQEINTRRRIHWGVCNTSDERPASECGQGRRKTRYVPGYQLSGRGWWSGASVWGEHQTDCQRGIAESAPKRGADLQSFLVWTRGHFYV